MFTVKIWKLTMLTLASACALLVISCLGVDEAPAESGAPAAPAAQAAAAPATTPVPVYRGEGTEARAPEGVEQGR